MQPLTITCNTAASTNGSQTAAGPSVMTGLAGLVAAILLIVALLPALAGAGSPLPANGPIPMPAPGPAISIGLFRSDPSDAIRGVLGRLEP
jgi:hypothetical protein